LQRSENTFKVPSENRTTRTEVDLNLVHITKLRSLTGAPVKYNHSGTNGFSKEECQATWDECAIVTLEMNDL